MTVPSIAAAPTTPQLVVESMLAALTTGDFATVGDLLDERVVYANVGLPTVRGRRRVVRILSPVSRSWLSFEVYLHAVAADGAVVLTERTDVMCIGPVRLQFWVTGRFDVRDRKITLWRDSFDFLDTTRALVRGLLGALVPSLRPRPPRNRGTAPGRH